MKVFLDANIIFSASQIHSPSWQLLEKLSVHATLVTHPGVWEEVERNLLSKRAAWSSGLDYWRARIAQSQGLVPCPDVGLPAKDAPVLAAAIASHADFLLTGDLKHFGHLYSQTVQGVLILSPRLLSEKMLQRGWC